MNKIENFIEYLESPSLNGIIFPSGAIKILNIEVKWSPQIVYSIKVQEEESIDTLETKGILHWNDCAVKVDLIDEKKSLEVVAGEGDYGSDGFVGVVDLNSRKLIWLAFFNCSNPFNKLEINDKEIYATSTNNCLWKFRIENPIDIVVECC